MEREDIQKEVLNLPYKNICLELATGVGKSKLALDIVAHRNVTKCLIVVPKLVLIPNWEDEIDKWGYDRNIFRFVTYASLHKINLDQDTIIFDEAHHLSKRCLSIVRVLHFNNAVLLSATINRNKKKEIKDVFPDIYFYSLSIKKAIDEDILPDPTVWLFPLDLGIRQTTRIYNPKAKGTPIVCTYKDRWKAKRQYPNRKIEVICTEKEYYDDLSDEIDYYKNSFMITGNLFRKNKWLHLCSERLKWLSELKTPIVTQLLKRFSNKRTLTFCNNIEQTQKLGMYCINSKNKDSNEILEKFNKGKIKHITTCQILNEGMNLVNCQVGIYANLNSSETIVNQRLGRLLRHKHPLIVIPYFRDTRDEELVNKMLENYNKDLVTTHYENMY